MRNHPTAGIIAPKQQRTNHIRKGAEGHVRDPGFTDEQAGFRSRRTIDESPETVREVRLAIARAKEGDRDAVRVLYLHYSDNVYGYLRSIVRDDVRLKT